MSVLSVCMCVLRPAPRATVQLKAAGRPFSPYQLPKLGQRGGDLHDAPDTARARARRGSTLNYKTRWRRKKRGRQHPSILLPIGMLSRIIRIRCYRAKITSGIARSSTRLMLKHCKHAATIRTSLPSCRWCKIRAALFTGSSTSET